MKQTEALFNKLYSPERVSEGFDKYDMLTMGKESLASYKAELRGKVERLFNNHAQKVGKREYVGLTKKQFLALLEDNPTEK